MGLIPDWQPIYYQPDELDLPYFIPDTLEARADVAAQYTTISRLDQGVGLILQELKDAGLEENTLVIYTSDNGVPFPNGRTNFYDSGLREPMFISSPLHKERRNQVTYSLASLLDVVPTLIDWYSLSNQNQGRKLTGRSLLPLLIQGKNSISNFNYYNVYSVEPNNTKNEAIFASHNLHEVTMYYPMRAIRTHQYKLIHNINYYTPFPIDQDLYVSPTFQVQQCFFKF